MAAELAWQRWRITIPAGRHDLSNGSIIQTGDSTLEVLISNVYPDEAAMQLLVERAGFEYESEPVDQP